MEVRNQDSLSGSSTWENIFKVFSRSSYWDNKVYRGYCEDEEKSVELRKVHGNIQISVCEQDYYSAFKVLAPSQAVNIFTKKYISKVGSSTIKGAYSNDKDSKVTIFTNEGIAKSSSRIKTSSSFLDKIKSSVSLKDKFEIFKTNLTPNYYLYFQVESGTPTQNNYTFCFYRSGIGEAGLKLHDRRGDNLFILSLEHLEKLLHGARYSILSINPQIRNIFSQKGKVRSNSEGETIKVKKLLKEISKEDFYKKIEESSSSDKKGILLTVFSKNPNTGIINTLTVINFGAKIEFRTDTSSKPMISQSFSEINSVDKYFSENGYSIFLISE